VRTGERRAMALFVGGSIVGIWTLPVLGATFVVLAALLFIQRTPRRDLLVAVGVVVLASLVFYAPILGQIISARSTLGGQQLGVTGFIVRPFEDLLQPSVQALLHQITPAAIANFELHLTSPAHPDPNLLQDVIAAVAAAAGAIVLTVRGERWLAAALLIPVFFTYLVLEVLRSYILSRFACFLIPLLLVLCATGIVGAARLLAARQPIAAVLVAAGLAFSLLALGRADRLAILISRPSAAPMVSNDPAAFGHYLAADWIVGENGSELQALFCNTAQPFVLLQLDLQPESPQASTCFAARPSVRIAELQIPTPGGPAAATVWDVPGSRGAAATAH
jgi:hypothetical protein